MARLPKGGLDYFPFDVHLDEKFDLIEAEFGLTGFAVVVKLFQKIYGQCGYYCEFGNEVALLFGRSIGLGGKVVSEIIAAAIKRGIFDANMYDRYQILTSRGIQKRYIEAVSRRKVVVVEEAYLLLRTTDITDNVVINPQNVCINSENVCINSQSKVKESKVKESRVDGHAAHAPTTTTTTSIPSGPNEVDEYCRARGNGIDGRYFYDYYAARGWRTGRNRIEDWRAVVNNWERRDAKEGKTEHGRTAEPREQSWSEFDRTII